MPAPPTHFALVGPLWAELEQALLNVGASGTNAKAQIDSLRRRLPKHGVAQLHYVRMQRNRVMHAPSRPLANPVLWERLCREAVQTLHSLSGRGIAASPTVCSSGIALGLRPVVPAPARVKVARPPRSPVPVRPARAPRRDDDGFPLWAQVLAWGLGAYVVLGNETLTTFVGLGAVCWLFWSIVGRR